MVRKQLAVLDLCLPEGPENVHKTMKQSQNYWIDNLTLLRKLARFNTIVIHVHIIS